MIKNLEKLVENGGRKFGKMRRNALEILDAVLEKMNGYNLVKSSVKVRNGIMEIKGRKINLLSYKRIFVVGFGKASASMAKAMEEMLDVDGGMVISTEDIELKSIKNVKGSHPLPDEKNREASLRLMEMVKNADKDDLVIVLISGGGSSLLCMPMVSLEAMREVSEELMKKGCNIEELNIVRKHLSHVKGGRLAAMTDARMVAVIISDIIGNPVDLISSGPTAEDSSTFQDAMKVLDKYGIKNEEVRNVIEKGIKGEIEETPSKLKNVENFVIGDINMACRFAVEMAMERGYNARIVSTAISGEAREMGLNLARYAIFHPRGNIVFIGGGETTVTVGGNGRGGRNQEMVLGSLEEIDGEVVVFLSCGTDGIDGNSPAAGAIADGESYSKARKMGIDINAYMNNNDSYGFFERMGDAIFTGYTGTNVMDIQIIIKK